MIPERNALKRAVYLVQDDVVVEDAGDEGHKDQSDDQVLPREASVPEVMQNHDNPTRRHSLQSKWRLSPNLRRFRFHAETYENEERVLGQVERKHLLDRVHKRLGPKVVDALEHVFKNVGGFLDETSRVRLVHRLGEAL